MTITLVVTAIILSAVGFKIASKKPKKVKVKS
jgi:hypothetical protein